MFFLVLLGLTFLIQILAAVWFVMVETGKGRRPALKFKILCALIYIADALLCVAIADAHTHLYFILIMCGLLVSMLGDITSSIREDKNDTALFLTHSASNIIYLVAYAWALHSMFNTSIFRIPTVIVSVAIGIALIPFTCRKDKKFKPILIISVLSTVFMLSGAIHLGISCQVTGQPVMQSVSCATILGAAAVGFYRLLHARQQTSPPPALKPQLPKYCAYFFGQMAIACSIILCGGIQ